MQTLEHRYNDLFIVDIYKHQAFKEPVGPAKRGFWEST